MTTLRTRVEDAYYREAALLDAHDIRGWLGWLTETFRYEVPIPETRAGAVGSTHSSTGLLAVETTDSIRLWADRLAPDVLGSAYSENPPARIRHFVSNVETEVGEGNRVYARSNVLLTWCRWNSEPRMLSAARRDVLEDEGSSFRLDRRTVLIDVDVVHLDHLRVIM